MLWKRLLIPMDDPADWLVGPPDAHTPVVHRLINGEMTMGEDYRTVRRRGTTDWLIILTLDGRGRFGHAGGDMICTEREVVLVRPRTPHDYGVEATLRHWQITYAHFHPRPEWLPLLDWPEQARGIAKLGLPPDLAVRVGEQLDESVRWGRSGLPQREMLAVNALESALLWCDTQNPRSRPLDERVLRVMEYVAGHLAEPLGLDGLAAVAHLSVSRLGHLFTEQVGTSPQRFVEVQRIDVAKQLLDLTSDPISRIAAQVGYPDPLYFSKRFRAHTGMSPRGYRER